MYYVSFKKLCTGEGQRPCFCTRLVVNLIEEHEIGE